ncbi:MAG: hypothetical protein KGL39_47450 [Patescibacteria group bacterium]|nr:hypothetical protein [Patescibacteria group bacterium]
MADLKDVLGPPKDEMAEEASEPVESGEDAYVSKLKDLFGLDDDKAQELRDVICGLAQEEMMEKEPEPEAGPGPKGKKAGIALILGK